MTYAGGAVHSAAGARFGGCGGGGDGGSVGDYVDDRAHRWFLIMLGGGAVGVGAATRQLLLAGRQRVQGISAALSGGARIGLADTVGDLGHPVLEHRGVSGIEPGPQAGVAGLVGRGAELHIAGARTVAGAPQRARIMGLDQRVDGLLDLLGRQRTPRRDLLSQLDVHGGHRVRVGDQVGAPHNGTHQQITDQPGGKQFGHPGQPVAQGDPAMGLVHGQPAADVLGGGQLGDDGGLGVDPPQFALVGGQRGAPHEQFGHHRLLACAGRVFGLGPAAGGINQRRISHPGQLTDLRQRTIEHAFDTRHHPRRNPTTNRPRRPTCG